MSDEQSPRSVLCAGEMRGPQSGASCSSRTEKKHASTETERRVSHQSVDSKPLVLALPLGLWHERFPACFPPLKTQRLHHSSAGLASSGFCGRAEENPAAGLFNPFPKAWLGGFFGFVIHLGALLSRHFGGQTCIAVLRSILQPRRGEGAP